MNDDIFCCSCSCDLEVVDDELAVDCRFLPFVLLAANRISVHLFHVHIYVRHVKITKSQLGNNLTHRSAGSDEFIGRSETTLERSLGVRS